MPRAGRAGADAGWLAGFLGQVLVVDAVHAQGALLHHLLFRIHLPGAVGAGPGAEPAADAVALVHEHDPVFCTLEAGTGRADRHAGRVGAMKAALWEVHDLRRTCFRLNLVGMDPVEKAAHRIRAIGVGVGERRAVVFGVPSLAGRDAGMAPDTGIQVDDKAKRPFRMARQRRHAGISQITPSGAAQSRGTGPEGRGLPFRHTAMTAGS